MWNKEKMSQLDAMLTGVPLILTSDLDLEFSRSNCISGMWGSIVMEWKGWELIGCPDVKHNGSETTGWCADWGYFDLEFSRSNCSSGMGGLIVMEPKGRESTWCPDVKHWGNEWTGHYADWGTFDLHLWPWIFKFKLYLGNGKPDCYGTKGTAVDSMPWWKTEPLCDLEEEDTVRDRGDLRCRRFFRLVKFICCSWDVL